MTPDAHGPADLTWGLYAGLVALTGGPGCGADHPDVTSGESRGPAGGVIAATNHGRRSSA